jgi:hypothetical protein
LRLALRFACRVVPWAHARGVGCVGCASRLRGDRRAHLPGIRQATCRATCPATCQAIRPHGPVRVVRRFHVARTQLTRQSVLGRTGPERPFAPPTRPGPRAEHARVAGRALPDAKDCHLLPFQHAVRRRQHAHQPGQCCPRLIRQAFHDLSSATHKVARQRVGLARSAFAIVRPTALLLGTHRLLTSLGPRSDARAVLVVPAFVVPTFAASGLVLSGLVPSGLVPVGVVAVGLSAYGIRREGPRSSRVDCRCSRPDVPSAIHHPLT